MDKIRGEADHVLVLNGGDNVSGKNDKEWLRQSYFLMDLLTEMGMDAVALQGTDMRMGLEDLKGYEKAGLHVSGRVPYSFCCSSPAETAIGGSHQAKTRLL